MPTSKQHATRRSLFGSTLALLLLGLMLLPSTAEAQKGAWTIRANGAWVAPLNADSDQILGNDGAEVQDAFGFAFSASYNVTDNIALTLLGSAPFSHEIDGSGNLDGITLGDALHLPPTLVAEYRFLPGASVNPYIGAGVNFTWFLDADSDGDLTNALNANSTDLELDNSFGLAGVIGFDWYVKENWGVNASVWFADIDTEADVIVNGDRAVEDVEVTIDPIIPQLGFFYQF